MVIYVDIVITCDYESNHDLKAYKTNLPHQRSGNL